MPKAKVRGVVLYSAVAALPLAAFAASTQGCSSSSSGAAPVAEAGPDVGVVANTDAGDAEASTKTVAIGLRIASQAVAGSGVAEGGAGGVPSGGADAGDAGGPQPIEGVKVCVYQNPAIPCVMTDADGHFMLGGLPPRANVPVSLEKTGYYPELLAVGTPSTDTDNSGFPQFLSPVVAMYPTVPGVTVDMQGKGGMVVFAVAPKADGGGGFSGDVGAQISIAPQSGNGPYFPDHGNLFVPGATVYTDFLASYFNLDPGMYTVTITDPVNDCEAIAFPYAGNGYPIPNTMHAILLPIGAGFTTLGGVLCTAKSKVVSTSDAGD